MTDGGNSMFCGVPSLKNMPHSQHCDVLKLCDVSSLSPFPVHVPFRCQGGLGAHHMEICEKRSLSRHIQYIQPASTLIDVNASAHTHTHTEARTCTQKGRVVDHWSVKWFRYRVVCVEYIFPSTFCGRCGLLVPLCVYVCWCVSVCCGALRLSVVGQEEVGSETKHKNKVTVSEQLLQLTLHRGFGIW